MMKTFKIILLGAVLLVCSLPLRGEQYKYVRGHNVFEVSKTATKYEVICRRGDSDIMSRNRNIRNRQFRMVAIVLNSGLYSFPAGDKYVCEDSERVCRRLESK